MCLTGFLLESTFWLYLPLMRLRISIWEGSAQSRAKASRVVRMNMHFDVPVFISVVCACFATA